MAATGEKLIYLDADVADAFHRSTAMSGKCAIDYTVVLELTIIFISIAQKGVSAFLLKPNCQRRRTKAKIKEQKA